MIVYVFDYFSLGNALREFYDNAIQAVSRAKNYVDNLSQSEKDDIYLAQVFELEAELDELDTINIYEVPHKIIWSY